MRNHGGKKHITSYKHHAIYGGIVDGELYYYVAKGDGTDVIFKTLDEAMDYIDTL